MFRTLNCDATLRSSLLLCQIHHLVNDFFLGRSHDHRGLLPYPLHNSCIRYLQLWASSHPYCFSICDKGDRNLHMASACNIEEPFFVGACHCDLIRLLT